MLEVEVKIKVDRDRVESKLIDMGFVKELVVYEKDVYFNSKENDLREKDSALRIRERKDLDTNETLYELNFKGPKLDDTTMTREETEFLIPSYSHGEKLLNGLSYYAAGTVEKRRTHYEKEGITCCFDQVTKLGEFLEIEIMEEDSAAYENALARIKELLEPLGLDIKDSIRHSYLSMILK